MALDTIPKQEGGKLKAVASGTLPSGQPVVVNSDGTVSVVQEISQTVGSSTQINGNQFNEMSSCYDPDTQQVIIAYRDNGNSSYGTAIVGAVSGTSISFGTAVVFHSNTTEHTSIAYDVNAQKAVISYESLNRGYSIVGTVSGTSISFGTAVEFANPCVETASTYDIAAEKVVVIYKGASSTSLDAIVGTVSGTSISFGTAVQFAVNNTGTLDIVYDEQAEKVVIIYEDSGGGFAVVGTVSGTSISFGSSAAYDTNAPRRGVVAYDSNNSKVLIVYFDNDDASNLAFGVVGTVSGTSISFGTRVQLDGSSTANPSTITYNKVSGKFVVAVTDTNDSYKGKIFFASISGTSVSFESPITFESEQTSNTQYSLVSAYDEASGRSCVFYRRRFTDLSTKYVVVQPAYNNLTAENYIGMSQGGAVADGSSSTVDIIGSLSTNQTGLTAGQQYFVQVDGTIGLTADDPSVLAGTAISATKLLVKT